MKTLHLLFAALVLLPTAAYAIVGDGPNGPTNGGGPVVNSQPACTPVYIQEDGHNCTSGGAISDCREDLVDTCNDMGRSLSGSEFGPVFPWGGWGAFFECGFGDAYQVACTGTCICTESHSDWDR